MDKQSFGKYIGEQVERHIKDVVERGGKPKVLHSNVINGTALNIGTVVVCDLITVDIIQYRNYLSSDITDESWISLSIKDLQDIAKKLD